ncbi:MAG: thioredoxin family protein [Hyphomonadaceae bacterium]|nr:thioredoxin family protein [Hyphomonadaceae bacterium]
MSRWFSPVLLALAAIMATAAAEPVRTANVEAELHASRSAIAPGERFTVVLRQSIREHWHTYWRNPGDSGEPTELTWRLPAGAQAGPIQWPTPEAIPFATLVNFGYSGEVLFPVEITAPASLRAGETLTLTADAFWLVCSDICIPEEATLTLSVPVAAQGRDDPEWAGRIAAAVEALPRRQAGVDARISGGEPARLSVALRDAGLIRNPRFFAHDRDVMQAAAPQRARVGDAGVSFTLTPGVANNLGEAALVGVVAYEIESNGDWVRRGVEIEAAPGEPIAGADTRVAPLSDDYPLAELEGGASRQAAPMDMGALIIAALLAFLGGLILNVMPCVLPVLSVKALAFAGGAHEGEARAHGLAYFAGVMATFLGLAVMLIALRSAGEAVGWGFQLQAPWVTSALALLFFVIGLNLLGVFSVGGAVQDTGHGLVSGGGVGGAFFTGALAVVAATPCTAPFMAGAIGVAVTQSPVSALAIFTALGLGFALPLTALHFAPALRRRIPKPGPWMDRAKQVLAFPMFATAIWLVWVLAEQVGPNGALAVLSVAAALAFVLFVGRWGRAWLAAGLLALAATAMLAWRPLFGVEAQTVLTAAPWSPARVAELRAEGRPIFVNFTAAWCVTCKVNEATSLMQPAVARAFADANVAYLVGDWTNRNDEIAAALAEHGRAGVPLYLYYPPGGEAQVLPQMLSQDFILETVEGDAP